MESQDYSEEIDFQKYWLVLKRRWLPATVVFGIIVVLAGIAASLPKPVYQAEGKLIFKADRSASLTGLKNDLGEVATIGEKSNPLSTETEIIRSLPIAQETVKALGLRDEDGKPLDPKVISNGLQVKRITETDILQIFYQDNDPKKAAAILNKVMEVYIQNDVQSNRAKATAARVFIKNQLPNIVATVRQADIELRKFKEENRVVSLEEEASTAVKVMSDLDSQIAQAQAKLAEATAKSTALRNQVGLNSEEAVAVTSLSQSPGVQEVLTELQRVQSQLAVERSRFLDTSPTVRSLEPKEAALKALLQERIYQVLGSQQQVSVEKLQ
ncbi:MAG: lipopolysaccharide biosynthesis protein, partial [Coleofasciculus sp. C3-bin4]|nr:lipopolysaccharide biosynthesis protein [Coleofasciculus sp. C3-bin4]